MFKTEICDIFNIKYPIILGGMLWVGKADLVAAVSEAGGLGLLGAGGMTIEEISTELKQVSQKTQKPFGVNIPLVRPDAKDMIDAAINSGASTIATSAGNPKKFHPHDSGPGAAGDARGGQCHLCQKKRRGRRGCRRRRRL